MLIIDFAFCNDQGKTLAEIDFSDPNDPDLIASIAAEASNIPLHWSEIVEVSTHMLSTEDGDRKVRFVVNAEMPWFTLVTIFRDFFTGNGQHSISDAFRYNDVVVNEHWVSGRIEVIDLDRFEFLSNDPEHPFPWLATAALQPH